MKLQTIIKDSKEILMKGHGVFVTVNTWSSLEGANIMVHGEDCRLMMAGAFRWEELDMITAALTVARTA